ncbi:MAG: 2-amino-4-hydroxy-6-hydroxymethyldihydropteridine diphosphokinase [Gammaproteobacteria bacterium]
MTEARAFVAVGSNLGDTQANAEFAVGRLADVPRTRVLRLSPWYRSRAIGPGTQSDYLNGVLQLATSLGPLELLDALQAIENAAGRVRAERWGPRTLDLDLLLYDDTVMTHERLSLPHPRLGERNFVVFPLYDLAPGLVLPGGQRLEALRETLGTEGLERAPCRETGSRAAS